VTGASISKAIEKEIKKSPVQVGRLQIQLTVAIQLQTCLRWLQRELAVFVFSSFRIEFLKQSGVVKMGDGDVAGFAPSDCEDLNSQPYVTLQTLSPLVYMQKLVPILFCRTPAFDSTSQVDRSYKMSSHEEMHKAVQVAEDTNDMAKRISGSGNVGIDGVYRELRAGFAN
jgi:hypothetical protein